MSKTIELCKVRQGDVFTLDGVDFVKLADEHGAVFALTRDVVLETVPFEKDGAGRKDSNNFSGSSLEKSMERWVQSKPHIYDALLTRAIDLTTMDGMTDYGCPLALIRALTIDEYRKCRRFIPLTDTSYWLATGWTTENSPVKTASYAYYVNADGSVSFNRVVDASFAARPALYLTPATIVSVEDGEEEAGIAKFTDTELMDELYRRRRATYDPD